jgi:hypothetical protein
MLLLLLLLLPPPPPLPPLPRACASNRRLVLFEKFPR